jgi:hypothetical protein
MPLDASHATRAALGTPLHAGYGPTVVRRAKAVSTEGSETVSVEPPGRAGPPSDGELCGVSESFRS